MEKLKQLKAAIEAARKIADEMATDTLHGASQAFLAARGRLNMSGEMLEAHESGLKSAPAKTEAPAPATSKA